MTSDELQAWAMKAWEAEVLKNLPAAKAARRLKVGQRESRKAVERARRSLATRQASTKRRLDTRLAEIERVARDHQAARDRKFDELRLRLAMGPK